MSEQPKQFFENTEKGIEDAEMQQTAESETLEAARQNFLSGYDFMKLGQALHHGNWQIAMVTVQRMQRNVQGLGLETFERQLTNIRQCIIHKQGRAAKDIMALMVAKRAQLLK